MDIQKSYLSIKDQLTELFTRDNYKYPIYLLFAILFYFIFFYQLNTMHLLDFDESRVAKSSYEMSENGNLIVVHYEGSPDLWSTKPALFHWVQALFIKVLGLSEVSVRLPNAFAGIILCVLMFRFVKRRLESTTIAVFSLLIFISAPAVIYSDHSFRTADYDAFLTLFSFISALYLFLFLENPGSRKFIYLFFLFFSLAVLTKGISAFFFFPGYFVYILLRKQLILLLKNKHFYYGLAGFVVLCGGYFTLREIMNPGYLNALNDMEILGRFNNTGTFAIYEEADPWFNFFKFIDQRFTTFYLLVPCGFILGLFSKKDLIRRFSLFSFATSLSLYIVISSSSSTNYWYDLPIYPFISIMVAIVLYVLVELIVSVFKNSKVLNQHAAIVSLTLLLFTMPVSRAISEVYAPLLTRGEQWRYVTVLQNYFRFGHVKDGSVIGISPGKDLTQSQQFYIDKLKADKNISVNPVYDGVYKLGDIVITMDSEAQRLIEEKYNCAIEETYYEIKTYKVIGPK